MRGPSPFTQGQRELIAAYVSGLNACTYCHTTHIAVAAACGVEPDLVTALVADIESAPTEARMKPILRYARKLTQSPARMTAADAAAVYDAGWNDALFDRAGDGAVQFLQPSRGRGGALFARRL